MNWIQNIGDSIKEIFQSARKPLPSIPPILLLCEIMNRPGLSAMALTGSIIARLEQEGFDTGVNPSGAPNYNNALVRIMSEEIVKHLKYSAKTESVIPFQEMSFIGMGGNAGGPVTLTLRNINYGQVDGISQ